MNSKTVSSDLGTPSMKRKNDRWKFYALLAVVGVLFVGWVANGLVKKAPEPPERIIYRVMFRGDFPYGLATDRKDTNWFVMEFNGDGTIRYAASWNSQSNAWQALIGTNGISWTWQ